MTTEEAEALFLSGLPGAAAELGLGTVVASSRLKVLAALPVELRGRASRLLERFHLDAGGLVPPRRRGALARDDRGIGLGGPADRARVRPRRPLGAPGASTRWGSCSRPATGTSSRPTMASCARTASRASWASMATEERSVRPERLRPVRVLDRVDGRLRARGAPDRGHAAGPARGVALARGRDRHAGARQRDGARGPGSRVADAAADARLAARGRRAAAGAGRRGGGPGAPRAAGRDRGARRGGGRRLRDERHHPEAGTAPG